MIKHRRIFRMGVLAVGLLAGMRGHALLTSGQLLTNFASATYSLSGLDGGTGEGGPVEGGINAINVPNSQTAWVLVTETPQLCLQLWKQATDIQGAPLASATPGSLVCFTISFSNCGAYTGWSVTITDVLPQNTQKCLCFVPSAVWVSGGTTPSYRWATSLSGPWSVFGDAGRKSPLYMRWLLSKVGLHKTGYIRYCVTIL